MASKHFSSGLIVNRYASALYDLSVESNSVEKVLSDLSIIEEINKQNKDFKLLIRSPLISSSDKLKIIKKILSKSSTNSITIKFIDLLSFNKRINFLPEIILRFSEINTEKRGNVIAEIISAEKLSPDQQDAVRGKLDSLLGSKFSLIFNIDKKIIGGLVIKVGSKMIDSSLASKINKLKIAMKGV